MIKTGLKRDTIDKFYTKKETCQICIELLINSIKIDYNKDLIIEPSAGNGSFIPFIEKNCKNSIYFDIEPENEKIIKKNFLEFDYSEIFIKKYNKIHILGNPPFGRQSSTAIKFIKKSSEFCNTISFILPRSFKKDSFQSKIPSNFHLIRQIDINHNSFFYNDLEFEVPCIFQIWEKKEFNRKKPEILFPNNFKFVKKNQNPHISFRRVGIYAGQVFENIIDKSEQSHYFIKFNKELTTLELSIIINKLNQINYDTENTVGPKSISKQEIILKINQIEF